MEKRIPRRRFKEFVGSGTWEEKKLGDFVHKAVDNRGKTPPLDSSGKHPLIEVASLGDIHPNYCKVDKYINEHTFKNKLRDYIKKDDILFSTVGSIGEVSLMDDNEDAAIAQNIVAFRAKQNYLPKYLYPLFSTQKNKDKAYRIVMGAVQPSIKVSQLINIKYCLTNNLAEQEKIGEFIQKLDRLIDINREKLGKLKASKSAYLEEMFPREGKDRPRRRFQGFTGAWEEKKFEEIFIYIRNNSLSRANLNYESGFIKNIHYGDILVKYKETLDVQNSILPYISNNYYSNKLLSSCLQNGDIVIADAAEDEIVGKCTEIYNLQDEKIVAGLHTIACRPIKRFEKWYLGYFINSNSYHDQLIGLMQGTKVESISKTSLKETYLKYPSLAEQEKIGNFFKKLDQEIELQEEKLEKLEKMKKAYLAEMFV